MGTFVCESCGGAFEKGWTDEESQAEAEQLFTAEELADAATVCDDCYRRIMGLPAYQEPR